MVTPNWEIVARAVCNMEGMGHGLKDKRLIKYIDDNWQSRVAEIEQAYEIQLNRQNSHAHN